MAYKDQLELLEDELKSIPDDTPTKGAWKALLFVLTGWSDVWGRIEVIEDKIKVIQSDARETKNMVSKLSGNGEIKFSEYSHPSRRRTDSPDTRGDADKLLDWIKREIIPGMARRFIDTVVIIGIVLAVLHWTDIINLAP